MVAAPEGNLTLQPIQGSSPSLARRKNQNDDSCVLSWPFISVHIKTMKETPGVVLSSRC